MRKGHWISQYHLTALLLLKSQPGSGKSYICTSLAASSGVNFIELDEITQQTYSSKVESKIELTNIYRAALATRLADASAAPAVLLSDAPPAHVLPTYIMIAYYSVLFCSSEPRRRSEPVALACSPGVAFHAFSPSSATSASSLPS